MRGLVILLVMALGCATNQSGDRSVPELDLEALAAMEAPARMEALSAWAVVARESGTLGEPVGAASAIASPGASQESWWDPVIQHVQDPFWHETWPRRSFQIAGKPQHFTWWTQLPTRQIDPTNPSATSAWEVQLLWTAGCTTIRGQYSAAPLDPSEWSNEMIRGDCISPPPTPVPEPGALALLASGGAALVMIQKTRSRTHGRRHRYRCPD